MIPSSIVEHTMREPYVRSIDHLHDELARIELLIRAQVVRWQLSGACASSEHGWGMVVVSREEVERYLASSFSLPGTLPEAVGDQLKPWLENAAALRVNIDKFCANGSTSDLRLLRLTNLFHLGTAESDILLLCLIGEVDERYRRLFGYLQDDATQQLASVELLMQILHVNFPEMGACRDLFSPAGNLRANHLIVMGSDAGGDQSLPQRSVRIDDRIAGFLLGSDDPDPRLEGMLTCNDDSAVLQMPARAELVTLLETLPENLRVRLSEHHESVRLFLTGTDQQLSLRIARAIGRGLKIPLLEFDVRAAVRCGGAWELFIDIAYREARLRNAAIYFHGCDALLTSDQDRGRWEQLESAAAAFHGLTLAGADFLALPPGAVSDANFWQLEIPLPDFSARRTAWLTQLPASVGLQVTEEDRTRLAGELAGAFQNTESQIEEAIAGARNLARRDHPSGALLTADRIFEACRRQASRRLVTFAQRIEPRRNLSLADLVLPAPNKRQLIELRNRIRFHRELFHRTGFEQTMRLGKGLLALFAGASGTGKTMAAEALASGQGVDLYKIDLSAIVSKWIGETEKNLSRIFAEAESSNGWLFFDEGESLFGSRGDIKQAQDRMLNLEVNYLLQRIEEFSGVVILATNLRQNIDDAFLRRIAAFVEFPNPSAESRAAIWKKLSPAMDHRDFDDQELARLAARFDLSGGNIRNIILDAMFRACSSDDSTLTLRHVAGGVGREYQKLGRPITSTEFGETFYNWILQDLLDPAPEQRAAVS
jgi:hypothetical protein